MTVTRDDVRRVAALARIGVAESQLDALVTELGAILDHMAVVARVEPASNTPEREGMPLATDEPSGVPLQRAREAFAPEMRDGFFLVPRLSTHDDGPGAA